MNTRGYSVAITGIGLTVVLVGFSELAVATREPALSFVYTNVAGRAENVALTYWPRIPLCPCAETRGAR